MNSKSYQYMKLFVKRTLEQLTIHYYTDFIKGLAEMN